MVDVLEWIYFFYADGWVKADGLCCEGLGRKPPPSLKQVACVPYRAFAF